MSDKDEKLVDGWLDHSLSENEEQQLGEWLAEDEQNMRQFVVANLREQQLKEAVRNEFTANEVARKVEPANKPHRPGWALIASVAMVAAVVFLTVWTLLPERPAGVQANVIAMNDLTLSGVEGALAVGQPIALGSFRLEAGALEIMLASNVRVEFFAPAEVVFENDKRLRLIEGRLSAEAGAGGEGFTVVTGEGEVVDLGTQFGVEVDREGESRVAVFAGSVEFHPNETMADKKIVTLTEGEALRFSARAGLRRWQQVAIATDRAGLSRIHEDGVVREVRDNLGEGDLRPFYGVIQGGMKPGALAFNDKPNPVWHASPGEEFPEVLQGADLIRTYYHFRFIDDYQLILDLNEAADVYVFMVTPGEIPDWLQERFERVDANIQAGPWHPTMEAHPAATVYEDGPHLNYSIWKCQAEPGEFILGAPLMRRTKGSQSLMYGVAIKAKRS